MLLLSLLMACATTAQVGPRPQALVDDLPPGPLKDELLACEGKPVRPTAFSIGHRGAPLQFPEHTAESYRAAARMGAGIVECDVAFTADRQLVCRHAQCDLHTTTDVLARPELAAKCTQPFQPADPALGTEATARCCTSDFTLDEVLGLCGKMDAHDPSATTVADYLGGTPSWRTDLHATCGTVLSHRQSIALLDELGVDFVPELKEPEVQMPFGGAYTRERYARQLVAEYREAGIDPGRVMLQSFHMEDIRLWLAEAPDFTAVYLDDRVYEEPVDMDAIIASLPGLADEGLEVLAPPLFALLALDEDGAIVPSAYALAAREAGLALVPWTLERSGPLEDGGGWYYQSISEAITRDSDVLVVLDVLARDLGVRGVFSDWPGTVTYYASCRGL